MAVNTRISTTLANARLTGAQTLFDGGFIDIYDGTQPATPETPAGANLLVTLTLGTPSFGTAANKSISANAITSGVAILTGVAAWCRITQLDHLTVLMDGSVGTASANVVLNSVNIGAGATVSCSSFTDSIPMQGA